MIAVMFLFPTELYAQALPLAETLILEFVAKLDTDQPLSKAYDHTFGEF